MKLLRVGPVGEERPAILDLSGRARDLSAIVPDIGGEVLLRDSLEYLASFNVRALPELDPNLRIGPCVANVGKFICIGLNYADHAKESGAPIPSEPIVFGKWTSAICGPNDSVMLPRNSTKLDWEVELGIVVGKPASYVSESEAEDHIAGYCVVNDLSERHFQLECGGQWDKGKGCDTFGPIGPWLVTADEVANPNDLSLWLEVNDERFQNGNTRNMIFPPASIVSYLSQFMSLQTGDVISTGTPPGVGMGQNPPKYLSIGDRIRTGIKGLGEQCQVVIASP